MNNLTLLCQIDKKMKDLILIQKKQCFEDGLFNLLKLFQSQIASDEIPYVGKGRQCYHFMFYEFKCIAYNLKKRFLKIDEEVDMSFILSKTYVFFINGYSHSCSDRIKEDLEKKIDKGKQKELNDVFSEIENILKGNLSKNKSNNNIKRNDVYDEAFKYLLDYTLKDDTKIKLFDGHRLRLIPFYRQICIIVDYIGKNTTAKDFYLELLCSQLSEHQIALLKIMYKFGTEEELHFLDNRDIKYFFEIFIEKYLCAKTIDCCNDGFICDTSSTKKSN